MWEIRFELDLSVLNASAAGVQDGNGLAVLLEDEELRRESPPFGHNHLVYLLVEFVCNCLPTQHQDLGVVDLLHIVLVTTVSHDFLSGLTVFDMLEHGLVVHVLGAAWTVELKERNELFEFSVHVDWNCFLVATGTLPRIMSLDALAAEQN